MKNSSSLEWTHILSADKAAKQFEDIMIRLMMKLNGLSRKECIRRRKLSNKDYKEKKFQQELATIWP